MRATRAAASSNTPSSALLRKNYLNKNLKKKDKLFGCALRPSRLQLLWHALSLRMWQHSLLARAAKLCQLTHASVRRLRVYSALLTVSKPRRRHIPACRFFHATWEFQEEVALYRDPILRRILPKIFYANDNIDAGARSRSGFVFPPFFVLGALSAASSSYLHLHIGHLLLWQG